MNELVQSNQHNQNNRHILAESNQCNQKSRDELDQSNQRNQNSRDELDQSNQQQKRTSAIKLASRTKLFIKPASKNELVSSS